MDRELPPYRQSFRQAPKASAWPAILIGAFLLVIIIGGVHLLGQTRQRWEANKAARVDRAAEFERKWEEQQAAQTTSITSMPAPRYSPPVRNPNFRCINGTLFRRLPNGWENIPGERCKHD